MPMTRVVTENNIGQGLKIEAGKLTANVDGTSIAINQNGKLTTSRYCYTLDRVGRVTCFSNDRWISQTDDLYGTLNTLYDEAADLGASPIIEWENRGDFIRAGTTIHDLTVRGSFNSAIELNDLILAAYLVFPNDPTMLQGVGISDDSHFRAIELFKYSWYNGLDGNNPLGVAVGGIAEKVFQRKIPVNHVVAQDAELRLFYKPVSKSPRPSLLTRYFTHTTSWLMSYKQPITP